MTDSIQTAVKADVATAETAAKAKVTKVEAYLGSEKAAVAQKAVVAESAARSLIAKYSPDFIAAAIGFVLGFVAGFLTFHS